MVQSTANFILEITVIDPDTNLPVELSVFKHENGGIFAIDSSYYEQVVNEEGIIQDPLNEKEHVILTEI